MLSTIILSEDFAIREKYSGTGPGTGTGADSFSIKIKMVHRCISESSGMLCTTIEVSTVQFVADLGCVCGVGLCAKCYDLRAVYVNW